MYLFHSENYRTIRRDFGGPFIFLSMRFWGPSCMPHTLHLQLSSAISAMDTAVLVQCKGTSQALITSGDLGHAGLES